MFKLVVAAMLVAGACSARAEVITYDFSASVAQISNREGDESFDETVIKGMSVGIGNTVHGRFSYDTSAPVWGGEGDYWKVYLNVGALSAKFDNGPTIGDRPEPYTTLLDTSNNYPVGPGHWLDSFTFSSYTSSPGEYLYVQLVDLTGKTFSNSAIPEQLTLDEFFQRNFYYYMNVGADEVHVRAEITSLERVAAVPEPETYGMLLGGLSVLAAVARRRRQV
ncbi:PEP-CTERM sorting domain-containing protein [Duganella callida]|uniref:PEP-CTERM sorting domain-containing protein n=1 Tax=Duganella callida TaxID=2561932 RepID=UPI001E4B8AE9|nr:PEP-CTERM sorting domain-containing protein [Duganella callida]